MSLCKRKLQLPSTVYSHACSVFVGHQSTCKTKLTSPQRIPPCIVDLELPRLRRFTVIMRILASLAQTLNALTVSTRSCSPILTTNTIGVAIVNSKPAAYCCAVEWSPLCTFSTRFQDGQPQRRLPQRVLFATNAIARCQYERVAEFAYRVASGSCRANQPPGGQYEPQRIDWLLQPAEPKHGWVHLGGPP